MNVPLSSQKKTFLAFAGGSYRDFALLDLRLFVITALLIIGFVAIFVTAACAVVLAAGMAARIALMLLLLRVLLSVLIVLLAGLVDGVEDAEIVLGVLKIAFSHHAVTRAGRIAAELEVFFEELLRGAANAQVRAAAVKDVITIERNVAAVVAGCAAAAALAGAVGAPAHAFHVHDGVTALFLRVCGGALAVRQAATLVATVGLPAKRLPFSRPLARRCLVSGPDAVWRGLGAPMEVRAAP